MTSSVRSSTERACGSPLRISCRTLTAARKRGKLAVMCALTYCPGPAPKDRQYQLSNLLTYRDQHSQQQNFTTIDVNFLCVRHSPRGTCTIHLDRMIQVWVNWAKMPCLKLTLDQRLGVIPSKVKHMSDVDSFLVRKGSKLSD